MRSPTTKGDAPSARVRTSLMSQTQEAPTRSGRMWNYVRPLTFAAAWVALVCSRRTVSSPRGNRRRSRRSTTWSASVVPWRSGSRRGRHGVRDRRPKTVGRGSSTLCAAVLSSAAALVLVYFLWFIHFRSRADDLLGRSSGFSKTDASGPSSSQDITGRWERSSGSCSAQSPAC